MNAKFFKTNKNIFLKYFDDCGQYSASQVYDALIQAGKFNTMSWMITSKNQNTVQDYINKTMEALNAAG